MSLPEPETNRVYEEPIKSISFKSTKLLPITEIVFLNKQSTEIVLNEEILLFCYCAAVNTLEAYLQGDFVKFDPLTTTNCCHGMSLLVRKLIIENSQLNIKKILGWLKSQFYLLKDRFNHETKISLFQKLLLPLPIISLTQIYILSSIKEENLEKGGWHSVFHKLKKISPISKKLCGRISKSLQTYFSNIVAMKYHEYLDNQNTGNLINGIPIKKWGEYVQSNYIRIDKRKRKYAPCLFSMQVSLAYLIQSRAKIAVINDLKCSNRILKSRFIQLLVGDGHSNFISVDSKDLCDYKTSQYEPVTVFSGCVCSDQMNHDLITLRMLPWLNNFPSLVLACDVFYPHYPNVGDDLDFNNKPIIPDDEDIKLAIQNHKEISGVSAWDPSLFCLSHIYTASFQQVFHTIRKKDSLFLPYGRIPNAKLKSSKTEREMVLK